MPVGKYLSEGALPVTEEGYKEICTYFWIIL